MEDQINETTPMQEDYLEQINNLKQSTVDKTKYDALLAENKKLLKSIVDGTAVETKTESKESINEIRKKLFSVDNDMSNLEYATNALELRRQLIEQGSPDPFLPNSKQFNPTTDDINAANRVANVLQECIDYADGNSSVFTAELQRRTIDVALPKRK